MFKARYLYIVLCFLFLTPVFISAQTAAELEKILENPAITYSEAAWFVTTSSGDPASAETDTPEEAFEWVMSRGWLPRRAKPDAPVTMGGLSFLLMKAFNIKGGMMYAIFPGPRYAYRTMVSRSYIQGSSDPDLKVSGEQFLLILGNVLNVDEESGRKQIIKETGSREREQTAAQRTAEQEALVVQINTQITAQAISDTSARITDEGITISLSNIQFLANSAELPDAEKRKLQEIARILENISIRKILVTGHTALAGSAEDQVKTSQDRAAAVAAYLVSLGARRAGEVFAQGFGSDRPIADNSTPRGMALNRRVEITLLEDQP